MVAISASLHPTSASRVTAVPRKSLNVTSAQKAQAKPAAQEAKISGADRSLAQVFSDLPAGPCGGPMACRIRA
jgi:hypothetical protein